MIETAMIDTLRETLHQVGKATEVCRFTDGSTVLLLPYGARILGLFPQQGGDNFLWTHPALTDVSEAQALYESDEWHDSGGDRTWLTPELDIFFPNYPSTDGHTAPRQLDASDYTLTTDGERMTMAKEMTIKFARPQEEVKLSLSKTVSPAVNPLRYERGLKDLAVQYAGYTLHTALELLGDAGKTRAQVGLWNLLQLPHGGDLMVPTYAKTHPRVIFGDIAPENLFSTEHLVTFRVRFAGEHKIGIRGTAVCGRAGYLLQTGDQWSLVVRNFFINPSGEYVDVPKDEPSDLGYAFHAVNVDSALGQFCELEYHATAIGQGTGCLRSDDLSQVWAYRGGREEILAIAQHLLSPGIA